MDEQVSTIRLYGELARKFGAVHKFVVDSPATAIRAMSQMIPGFDKELMNSHKRNIAYKVYSGKNSLEKSQIHDPTNKTIRIVPVIIGSKGGLGSIIIGAALIVAAVYYPPLAAAAQGSFAAGVASAAIGIGVSLVAGGVMQLLAPQKTEQSSTSAVDNGASYNFNGPVNTTAQGNPVPILYGRVIIGSAIISAGIYSEDQQ